MKQTQLSKVKPYLNDYHSKRNEEELKEVELMSKHPLSLQEFKKQASELKEAAKIYKD